MRTNEIELYKKQLKLTAVQRQVLVGLLLGDGHLESVTAGKTYRLKTEYSEKQKDYLLWLWRIFREWVRTPPSTQTRKLPSGATIRTIEFTTYSHGALRFYAQQFYKNGKKIIPKIIGKQLTPLGLAVWFMDDGSWKSNLHRTFIIHADGYAKKDLLIIQKVFREKFGIDVTLHKQYKHWRVYVKTESAQKFKQLIEPYIISSMRYKLGNKMPKE
jgi:hypothetical protein